MRVLVGCETSGNTRNAFRKLGHDAWSCDLLPAVDNSRFHIQDDVRNVLHLSWDIGIFHPDCTYLTGSAAWAFNDPDYDKYPGVGYHQKVKPGTLVGEQRRVAREDALSFVRFLMTYDKIKRRAIENPVGAISRLMKPTQYIQPYDFGEDASKKTCLWLFNLPPLVPTKKVPGRMVMYNGKMVERWSNQTDSGQSNMTPSDDRWSKRSVTYPGWSRAMAHQWGEQV